MNWDSANYDEVVTVNDSLSHQQTFRRKGNIVSVDISSLAFDVNSQYEIQNVLKIPVGFIPESSIRTVGVTNNNQALMVSFTTGGNVSINSLGISKITDGRLHAGITYVRKSQLSANPDKGTLPIGSNWTALHENAVYRIGSNSFINATGYPEGCAIYGTLRVTVGTTGQECFVSLEYVAHSTPAVIYKTAYGYTASNANTQRTWLKIDSSGISTVKGHSA